MNDTLIGNIQISQSSLINSDIFYNTLDLNTVEMTTGYTYNPNLYHSTSPVVSINTQKPTVHINSDGIKLEPSADIQLGSKSLKTLLEKIESRLAILEPNTSLENDWKELKKLGDQYRTLEKEIQDKLKTYDILKT